MWKQVVKQWKGERRKWLGNLDLSRQKWTRGLQEEHFASRVFEWKFNSQKNSGNSPTSRRPDMICWIVSCGRHRELLFSSSAIKRKRSRKGPATRWVVCLPCEKGPTLCLAYIGVDSGGGSSKQPHCRYEAQFFPPKIGFAARNG